MLALPKAFATVGIACGLGLFVLACFLTYFSTTIIVRWGVQASSCTWPAASHALYCTIGSVVVMGRSALPGSVPGGDKL